MLSGFVYLRCDEQYHAIPPVSHHAVCYLCSITKCAHRTRFAKAARVEDFSSRDLFSPERERTTILLSAFINFVKFTEQYCDSFLKDLRERSDALIIQRDDAAEQLKEIQERIDEIK